MRFLKPTKLGCFSASWLRHEVRVTEWVAKTWRYFVSRMRWTVLLTLGWAVLPRYIVERGDWGASRAVAVAVSVMVAMAMRAEQSSCERSGGSQCFLNVFQGQGSKRGCGMTFRSGDWKRRKQRLGRRQHGRAGTCLKDCSAATGRSVGWARFLGSVESPLSGTAGICGIHAARR